MSSFRDLTNEVFRAHASGRFNDALRLTRSAESHYPHELPNLIYWEACLLCRINNTDAAIAELQRGVDLGLWWNPSMLDHDPDLAVIKGNAAFEAVKLKCSAELQNAQANATTDLVVLKPANSITKPPLVVALHQRLGHLEKTVDAWRSVRDYGAVLAVPRSSQQLGMSHFGWDDNNRAVKEINALWEQIRDEASFDSDKVILSGMSQGADLAIQLALSGTIIPCVGFLVVVPPIHELDELVSIAQRHPNPKNFRCWILSGENDWGKNTAVEFADKLRNFGFNVDLDIVPGLAHDFPSDFNSRLHQALEDILE